MNIPVIHLFPGNSPVALCHTIRREGGTIGTSSVAEFKAMLADEDHNNPTCRKCASTLRRIGKLK